MEATIKRLSPLSANMLKDTEHSKTVKGYDGRLALVKVSENWMFVPDVNRLPEYVDFVWAFVVFGHPGRTKNEAVVCGEISKYLSGKPYSVKKMAEVAPQIRL